MLSDKELSDDDLGRLLDRMQPENRVTCADVASHLFELLDHEMPGDVEERLLSHVRTCPYCSELADAEVHVRNIMKRACASGPAPEGLVSRVRKEFAAFEEATGERL
ncbi:MAG: zf-HC2 domain-containing protein [Actinomycetaceae bacterium]|nr:hypothetical protein [Actinomycetaceae bacterium]MDY6082747.1 zf-HC2 domain-containing protein [Actinomycetaceae bacterium]